MYAAMMIDQREQDGALDREPGGRADLREVLVGSARAPLLEGAHDPLDHHDRGIDEDPEVQRPDAEQAQGHSRGTCR